MEGEGKKGKRGKGRATGAFRQIKIYDYTPGRQRRTISSFFSHVSNVYDDFQSRLDT